MEPIAEPAGATGKPNSSESCNSAFVTLSAGEPTISTPLGSDLWATSATAALVVLCELMENMKNQNTATD
jgi:hypothetical protein